MTDPLTPQPAPAPATGDVWLDLVDAVEVSDRLRLLSTPPAQGSTPPLPYEWPADPRDPLVCVHGCGCEPGDALIEDECPRRLRAALEEDRDRLRAAARAVVAAWDRPNAMPAFGAAIAGLRAALAGRGGDEQQHPRRRLQRGQLLDRSASPCGLGEHCDGDVVDG